MKIGIRVASLLVCLFAFSMHAQWQSVQPLTASRYRHGAATGPDGYIYVIGGVQNGQCVDTVERYNPRTNGPWELLQNAKMLKGARCDATVITGPDGKIYVVGGTQNGESIKLAERFNTTTLSFEPFDELDGARSRPAVAVGPDLRLYALGGFDAATNTEVTTVEAVDPFDESKAWDYVDTATVSGVRIGMTGLDGQIYTFGVGPGARWGRFDGATWTDLGPITPASNGEYTATAGPDGRMYLLGVGPSSKINGSSGAVAYTPFGPQASVVTSTPGRVLAGAATAAEGRLFVTGGHGGGSVFEMNDVDRFESLWAPVPVDTTAWFGFDEANGPAVADQWGGNSAVAVNNPTRIAGRVYNALRLNGANQYVKATGPGLDFGNGEMTIEGWVYWQPLGNINQLTTLLDKRTYAGGKYTGYSVYFYKNRLGFQLANGQANSQANGRSYVNYVNYPGTATIGKNRWVHIAITVDRARNVLSFYVNGVLDVQKLDNQWPALAGSTTNPAPLFIGRHSFSSQYFRGAVDELTFYDRALRWPEIRAIFLAGREGKLPE